MDKYGWLYATLMLLAVSVFGYLAYKDLKAYENYTNAHRCKIVRNTMTCERL